MNYKLIRFASNEMVIADVEKEDDEFLYLQEPFALIPTNDGKLNFIPWCPLNAEGTPVEVYKKNVVYYATPNEDVINNYKEIFSNIITPPNSGKIIT